MSSITRGSFVVHAKLPELGAGEVLSNERGAMRVRFASGERNFSTEFVEPHLNVTQEGPAPAVAKTAKRSRKAAAAR